MYDYNEVVLENWYDEYKQKYPHVIQSFQRYLQNKDDSDIINEVKHEILKMLYNRNMIQEKPKCKITNQVITLPLPHPIPLPRLLPLLHHFLLHFLASCRFLSALCVGGGGGCGVGSSASGGGGGCGVGSSASGGVSSIVSIFSIIFLIYLLTNLMAIPDNFACLSK